MSTATASFYETGQKALDFLGDGTGFAYYPNGKIAICVSSLNGEISSTFYSKGKNQIVLCSFDALGIGSCCFGNGKPRVTTTASGGNQFDEKGNLVKTWTWVKGLPSEIDIMLSNELSFFLKSRAEIVATFKCNGHQRVFQLGLVLRRKETYLTKVISRDRHGHLILDMEKVRASLQASKELKESLLGVAGQTAAAPLPKITVHYCNKVQDPDVRRAIDGMVELGKTATSDSFRVDIAPPIETTEDGKRIAVLRDFVASDHPAFEAAKKISGVQMGGRYLPFKQLKTSYKIIKKVIPLIKANDFDKFIASCPESQVVMVVVVASWSHECTKAVQVWEHCYGDIYMKDSKDIANPKKPEELSMRVVKFDAAESNLLKDKYNLRSVPMYLGYVGGRLVYAKNHMMIDPKHEHKAFATSPQDAYILMLKCQDLAMRGMFLSADFKFGPTDDSIGEGMANRLQSVFGAIHQHQR